MHKRTCINIHLQHNLKAVYFLLQCCLSNISTTMNDRDIRVDTDLLRSCINVLENIYLQHNLKAVYLLLQCCSSNISTTMNDRDISNYINTQKDMYKYFIQHQLATKLQGCLIAAAVLFVKYFNNSE